MIRLWSSGALLTTDLMFSMPKVRLVDDDGPGRVDLNSSNNQE